jgi:hypothetical protein
MYIRKKKNKSGSSSVFIVDESRGDYRVIKRFGVGRTKEELELLEQRANQYLLEITGLSHSLFEKKTDVLTGNPVAYLSNKQLRLIGPELVYGRIYDKIGFGRLHNEMFRHLVISHLISPDCKAKAIDYLHHFIGKNHGVYSIYRFLDNINFDKTEQKVAKRKDVKREIEKIAFACTRNVLNKQMKTFFCHLTPLRFEAGEEKELPKMALSKNRKHQFSQLYLGLLTASGCNPVGYELFEENALQDNSFVTSMQHWSKRCDLPRPIIVADAALLSKNGINALKEDHYEYISGAEPKNETEDIRRKILNLELKDGDIAEISKDGDCRLIVFKSPARVAMDCLKRERGLKRLQQKINSGVLSCASINNRGYNKYLKLKGKTKVVIDRDKCSMDAAWDGLTGYLTNTKFRPEEIVENYHHFLFVQQAFSLNKTDLLVRPVWRHGIRNRVEALICICFTAFTTMLELERQLKASGSAITLKKAQEIIHTLYRLANSNEDKKHIRNMDRQQMELCRIVEKTCTFAK